MAGVPLVNMVMGNNNAAHTDLFRTYIKDNLKEVKANCIHLTVDGAQTNRYKNNSHAMWLELGLDAKYCITADYINSIKGDTSLMYLSHVYLPDANYLDKIATRVNRR